PMIHSINGGAGFNNTHQDAVRAALLIEPTDWIKNTTTVDYFKATESGSGYYLLRRNFSYSALFVPQLGPVVGNFLGSSLDAQTDGYIAGQKNDFYGAYTDSSGSGRANRRSEGVTNDTSISLGDYTIRNIFGYRKNRSDQLINTGAVGPLDLGGQPFTLFHAAAFIQRQYITNELQFLGTIGRLNFIVGGFYNNDKPDGVSGSTFDAFTTPGTPASVVTAHVENKNKALFGQVTYKITDKLSATGGLRYSWDKVSACGGAIGNVYATDAQCRTIAAQNIATDGVGVVKNSGSAPSWTVGLDWKVNSDLLLYITSRRGYRAANVNTPLFETVYTTGGTDPACGFGTGKCVDLRPYQKTGKEKLTDVEIGEKWDFRLAGARGRINTAAYYAKYKNALQFLNAQTIIPSSAKDNPTNASFGANVADLTIWGVELEASVSPSDTLTISFNGAYNHTTIDRLALPAIQGIPFSKASVSTYSPKVSGTVSANWTLPIEPLDGKVSINGDLFMTDDFGGQNGEKLPGYNLVNLRLDWKDIGGLGLDLSGFVRNLTKEHYFASPSVLLQSFPVSSVAVGDPRTYGVTARYSF
ncbi:MAG: TonB-dependent receptor, partial [Rhizorhabdus sp.]|nr:TonB-dependent receptor [Rhizorhabdus sp.]